MFEDHTVREWKGDIEKDCKTIFTDVVKLVPDNSKYVVFLSDGSIKMRNINDKSIVDIIANIEDYINVTDGNILYVNICNNELIIVKGNSIIAIPMNNPSIDSAKITYVDNKITRFTINQEFGIVCTYDKVFVRYTNGDLIQLCGLNLLDLFEND